MRYTVQMENSLPWDSFDDESDDYAFLIEQINSEDFFRSFGDGLLSIIKSSITHMLLSFLGDRCISPVGHFNNSLKR